MSKIECPHCGRWQEARPHVILCEHCYVDIKDTVDTHFREVGEEPTEVPDQPERPLWIRFLGRNETGPGFVAGIWKMGRDRAVREGHGLSGPGTIFNRTFATFFTRFWPLYPLTYLSLSFLMLIGVFASVIGVQNLFPEEYPADPSMTPAFALGIAACLFVFFYAQAAFVFALANRELTFGDALFRAWQRLAAYVALIVIMVAATGVGMALFLIPGVIAVILFSFAPFVFAKENLGLVAALSKSVQYVSGSVASGLLEACPRRTPGNLWMVLLRLRRRTDTHVCKKRVCLHFHYLRAHRPPDHAHHHLCLHNLRRSEHGRGPRTFT